MTAPVKSPKKLIEVALPLDAINAAASREKSIRHGHPSTLHLWWARRPLAAARAVIFAQMVNDPSWKWELEHPGELPANSLKASWAASRKRLFAIIEDLVKWENTSNEIILEKARAEIRKSWRETCELNKDHPEARQLFDPDNLPSFHDPFAGGGALPLEAQRLGLNAYASDLNPVAVLINKAMIEIPPKFADLAPVNPEARGRENSWSTQWKGAQGLAEDVRYYGQWMREEAKKRIGHLYPTVEITANAPRERPDLKPLVGEKLTVIAWIWARTVKSPNPAFRHVDVPLASTFVLSSKSGKEAWIEPRIDGDNYSFHVRTGKPPNEAKGGTKLARANFKCLLSGSPISGDYIKAEGKAGRLGECLLAIIAEGNSGRVFLSPNKEHEQIALEHSPDWSPDLEICGSTQYVGVKPYGMGQFSQIFMKRQLIALNTFSNLIDNAKAKLANDCKEIFKDNAEMAVAYQNAVGTYLSLALGRSANYWSSLTAWGGEFIVQTFGRQAYPMIWDHAEVNPFSSSTGNWLGAIEWIERVLAATLPAIGVGIAEQQDAQSQKISVGKVVSTDPPYYDNVPYADLSDFFYIWLRRPLRHTYPGLFSTLAVPKAEELVAFAYRHEDGKLGAEAFFLDGMTQAMHRLSELSCPTFPVTIYYAVRQAETDVNQETASTGWDTFLEAVISAGFGITGTWPMRTERSGGFRNSARNSLASSIILVCRPRPFDAPTISRRAFIRELNQVLPDALDEMTRGSGDDQSPVAPVDLSQAIIGPGMAVFSKYAAVLEADGTPMKVWTALQLINRFLAEDDFDHDTQFCLHWFEQYGWRDGRFGEADTLARAKGTSVDGVRQAGVLFAAGGVVRLLKWKDYPVDWDPEKDERLPIWEALHHLIRVFKTNGESGAGKILASIAGKAEATRQLAYRLYTLCERAGWPDDARAYNEIVTSWTAIESAAAAAPKARQTDLFE